LNKNTHDGQFGEFISYDVAVRSTRADAWKADSELVLTSDAIPMIPAQVGNFSRQTYTLTNTGKDDDIVRITLSGALAEKSGIDVSTADSHAVIHNNLFALAAGETIEFDVFVKNARGLVADFDLTVTASSETNAQVSASADLNAALTVSALTNPGRVSDLLATGDVILTTPSNLGIFEQHSPFVIPEGRTLFITTALNIQRGAELVIEGNVVVLESGRINNQGSSAGGGKITIAENGTLINDGYVENVSNSSVINLGTIINNARFEVRASTRFVNEGEVIANTPLTINRSAILTR